MKPAGPLLSLGRARRWRWPLLALVIALVSGASWLATRGAPRALRLPAGLTSDVMNSPISALPCNRFYETALALVSDKVTPNGPPGTPLSHHYASTYDRYLGHIPESAPLRLLEIGVGCGMGNGAGNSILLWRRLFPRAAVSFIELDGECATPFRAAIEETGGQLFIGSQADPLLLATVVKAGVAAGGFDMIVDDGGHDPLMQRTSLQGLWPALRPGGLYVIEDLLTSYWDAYEMAHGPNGTMPFLKDALDAMNCHSSMPAAHSQHWREYCAQPLLAKQFQRMDCAAEVCAIVKHRSPAPPGYSFN